MRNINLNDNIKVTDNAKIVNPRKAPNFHTEVIATNELGEVLFTEHNQLLFSGALFLFEKLANVNAPVNIKTMNTDLNILPTEEDPGFTGPRRDSCIFGFVVGVGGCTDVFDTVKDVKFKDRNIDALIPFRKVPKNKDLSSDQKKKYCMRVENDEYYDYYIKKFETDPVIKAEFDEPGFPSVPANVDELGQDKVINSYLQFTLKITRDDIREYAKLSGGGLNKARINSLGLVFGYPDESLGYQEYKGVKTFSKINMNNEPLDNETKEINIIYKIYI